MEDETNMGDPQEAGVYVTRSGRASRPPQRLIETAYAALKETYLTNFSDTNEFMMKVLLFQKAVSQ
jgi:hypothetical protein